VVRMVKLIAALALIVGIGFHANNFVEAASWYFFVHPTSETSPNYYYDLDRRVNYMRDWTGWSCSNCTDVWGHTYDQHMGTDYPLANGRPIRSAQQGTVTEVVNYQYNQCGVNTGPVFGTYVKIRHPAHGSSGKVYYTTYAHMTYQSPAVTVGQNVGIYQYLGAVGQTGNACGYHLHWAVEETNLGNYVDPFDKGLVCGFYGSAPCSVEPSQLDEDVELDN